MTMASDAPAVHTTQRNRRIPFEELQDSGAYVSNATGNLFRIPADALVGGRSPTIEIVCKQGTMMTKLSDDPWIPISKARQLAADSDLHVNF